MHILLRLCSFPDWATVGLCELASANIVGYNGATLRGGGQAAGVGASFVNVNNTDLTLGDLKVVGYDSNYDGFEVIAKKLNGAGVGGTSFYWCDYEEDGQTYYGWYDGDMNEYNTEKVVLGEGLWVYSPNANFKLQSSGSVPTSDVAVTLRGEGQAKMVANPMPLQLSLGEVLISGYTGSYDGFEVIAKKLNGAGVGGTSYYWCDYEEDGNTYCGWYDADMNDYNDVPVSAGEGLWIYSPSTSYSVVFPAPVL